MLDRGLVLPHLIRANAERAPDSPAMIDAAGRTDTYADLDATFRRWAGGYKALGVAAGDTVVTMVPNSFEAFYAWLGVAWLRGIEVPANNMYRGQMLQYLLNDSGARVALIHSRFLPQLREVIAEVPALELVVVPDLGADDEVPDLGVEVRRGHDFLADAAPLDDEPGPERHDVSAMIYTSGTTGPSKGVLVPWAELFEFARVMPDDVLFPGASYYSVYPAFHVSGKSSLYMTSRFGARLVLRESFSVSEFWNDARRHDVRVIGLVGPLASLLLSAPPAADDADNPVEDLYIGPVIAEIDEFMERFGIRRVGTGFGMTEIGVPLATGWGIADPASCGRRREGPPGYEVRVVDEHDQEVGPGVVGELIVRADEPWVINCGYWNRPEATAAAWRNGWFHTGDGFRYDDDGNFFFVDRMKDAIRRRGENISSFEVERGINEHPDVLESAVVAVPSEHGEDEVKAIVVLWPGRELRELELIEFLEPRLPRFMIPRYVELVTELPKTDATFRTRKVELRAAGITEATWDREVHGRPES